VFLIDQSTSMAKPLGGRTGQTKADGVAEVINRLLFNLILKSTGTVLKNRYHIGVIGYGLAVGPAFDGALQDVALAPLSDLANNPRRVEQVRKVEDDGRGGKVEKVVQRPVWFEPTARGKTRMCRALALAAETVEPFIDAHPHCYPPLVINISDGQATDGDPRGPAEALCNLSSSDGNVLLFNLHLSPSDAEPILFPDSEASLPEPHACLLFRMSSRLPDGMRRQAAGLGFSLTDEARGFAFNADLVSLVNFLDIGTRVNARG
jgi:hypothetical protein